MQTNQSEKAVRTGFRYRNRAVFYTTLETCAGKKIWRHAI